MQNFRAALESCTLKTPAYSMKPFSSSSRFSVAAEAPRPIIGVHAPHRSAEVGAEHQALCLTVWVFRACSHRGHHWTTQAVEGRCAPPWY